MGEQKEHDKQFPAIIYGIINRNEKLTNQQRKQYRKIKYEEYSSCNHIWVNTLRNYDITKEHSYKYCGCIKCGLDERVFYLKEELYDFDYLNLDQKIMYIFMKDNDYKSGIDTKILCDLDLAKAIYKKIKHSHPNIDDKTATKYLKSALTNIRNIKVNEERKKSRAKRLTLKLDFNKWTIYDISYFI